MLIITADDYGLDSHATNSILSTYNCLGITSISAMVFMADSIRASELAHASDVEVGFHLNITLIFSERNICPKLLEHQRVISAFLLSTKFTHIIYNPFLANAFDYVFRSQEEEFFRLYKKAPAFYNGHHHMHLCSNIIFSNLLPHNIPIRRTFTFKWGEKDPLNIIYRRLLDRYISRNFISTNAFYSLGQTNDSSKMERIINLSKIKDIELMAHPSREEELNFIRSDKYWRLIGNTKLGRFEYLMK